MAKKNKALAWKIEYATYRIVETLFRFLPVSLCHRIGSALGLLSRLVIKKRRIAVERNLRIAFGDSKSKEELLELSKEVFRRNGGNLLASIKTATMSVETVKKCITIEDGENCEQFIKENNGAIMLLPHMGNWEVSARLNDIVYPGIASGGMYRPLDNPHLDALVKNRREISGSKLFARSDGMATPLQFIRDTGLLAILADQRVGNSGQYTNFFGRLTSFSPLPQIYKKRTKCGLIGLAIITESPGKWRVKYTYEATKDTFVNTGDIAHMMEKLMRLSPADCFWMQDRWRLEDLPLHLAGKAPIIHPTLSENTFRKQQFGIYLDLLQETDVPALETLAQHRPDLSLTCYTASQSPIASPLFQVSKCPNVNDTSSFTKFFESQDSDFFTDVLLLPISAPISRFENLHTHIHLYNEGDLLESLKQAGLPNQPYA